MPDTTKAPMPRPLRVISRGDSASGVVCRVYSDAITFAAYGPEPDDPEEGGREVEIVLTKGKARRLGAWLNDAADLLPTDPPDAEEVA